MKLKILKVIISILTIFIAVILLKFFNSGMHWSIFRDEQINNIFTLIYNPSDKLWVHRCDSIEKLQLMIDRYSGVEIDAVFYPDEAVGRKFDISHDEEGKVEYPFEAFLPTIAEHQDKKIWFDFKNLNKDTSEAALEELEYLLNKYNINKNRFIIESHQYKELELYHKSGFYTSFYVTTNDDWFFNNEAGEEYFINEVQEVSALNYIDAISFPMNYYDLVKRSGV